MFLDKHFVGLGKNHNNRLDATHIKQDNNWLTKKLYTSPNPVLDLTLGLNPVKRSDFLIAIMLIQDHVVVAEITFTESDCSYCLLST